MKRWGKLLAVIVGAVIITALGIDAADTLTGSKSTMLAQLVMTENGCPEGMVPVPTATTFSCVDQFEASVGGECPHDNPKNGLETRANLNNQQCLPESTPGSVAWRNVSREQAAIACSRAGKRLPSAAEWYTFAIGTTERDCNVRSGSVMKNETDSLCRSSFSVVNAVGNVWEWVSDDVIEGQYNGRALPGEGYVAQVDSSGIATMIGETETDDFESDYFWSKSEGAFGMLRGGFYDSRSDAGVYSVHANTAPTMQGEAIGFRCVY